MSIEYYILARFPEPKAPVERFLDIATAFDADPNYGTLFSLSVRDIDAPDPPYMHTRKGKYRYIGVFNSKRDEVFAYHHDEEDLLILTEQLPAVLQHYRGEKLWIEGAWEVRKRYDKEDNLQPWWVELTCVGRTSQWRIASYYGADCRYLAGNNHSISTKANVTAMAEETQAFVRLGAEKVWGYHGDVTSDPRTTFLCYHRNPDQYRTDLSHPPDSMYRGRYQNFSDAENLRPITNDDVLYAALYCPDEEAAIDVVDTPAGPIVYCSTIWKGLGAFYETLYDYVRTQP